MVIPLQKIIDDMPEPVIEAISRFSCRDLDVETFLKNKALEFERRNKSRTYLIFGGDNTLWGYFTISLKALPFASSVSRSMVKNIDGFSKDIQAVGIILIGQFGKDMITAKDVSGAELLDMCVKTIYEAQKFVGGRFVLLECQNIDKIVEFYRNNGFEFLQYDERDKYLQMVRKL
jgi:F0F1-type ATP synthase gamma subunit